MAYASACAIQMNKYRSCLVAFKMTTRCCVAKFIRTLSTVISTIDLKLPLYTAGVHRVSDISIIHLFVVMCHCATSSPHLNPQVHSAHPPRLVPASGFRVTWHPLLLCLVSQISVASIVHLSEGYAQIIGPFNPVPLMQIPTTSIHIPLLIEYNKRHSRFQVLKKQNLHVKKNSENSFDKKLEKRQFVCYY